MQTFAALRTAFFPLFMKKTQGGGYPPPPSVGGLNIAPELYLENLCAGGGGLVLKPLLPRIGLSPVHYLPVPSHSTQLVPNHAFPAALCRGGTRCGPPHSC